MEIRFAKAEDEQMVLKLMDELGEEMNEKTGFSPSNTEAQKLGGPIFRKIINRKDTFIFVATEGEKILGSQLFTCCRI